MLYCLTYTDFVAGEATVAVIVYSGAGFFVRVPLCTVRGDNPDLPFVALTVKQVR